MVRMKSNSLFTVVMAAVFAIGIGTMPAQAATKKVIFGAPTSIETDLPFYVAKVKSYFTDADIDWTYKILGGGKTRDALAAGAINFGLLHVSVVWIAHNKKLPIKFVSMYYTKGLFGVLASNRLKGKVKSLEDLRGKRIISFIPGAAAPSAFAYYLARAGLDIEKDVKMVYLSSVDMRIWFNSINTGKADALGGVWEPGFSRALAGGTMYPLLDIRDPKQHDKWIGGDINGIGMVTTGKIIENDPDLVRGMVGVADKGLAYIRQASAEDLTDITLEAGIFKMDRDMLLKIVRAIKPNYTRTGAPSVSQYNRIVKMYQEGNFPPIKKAIPYEAVIDASFAGRAE